MISSASGPGGVGGGLEVVVVLGEVLVEVLIREDVIRDDVSTVEKVVGVAVVESWDTVLLSEGILDDVTFFSQRSVLFFFSLPDASLSQSSSGQGKSWVTTVSDERGFRTEMHTLLISIEPVRCKIDLWDAKGGIGWLDDIFVSNVLPRQ